MEIDGRLKWVVLARSSGFGSDQRVHSRIGHMQFSSHHISSQNGERENSLVYQPCTPERAASHFHCGRDVLANCLPGPRVPIIDGRGDGSWVQNRQFPSPSPALAFRKKVYALTCVTPKTFGLTCL